MIKNNTKVRYNCILLAKTSVRAESKTGKETRRSPIMTFCKKAFIVTRLVDPIINGQCPPECSPEICS